MSMQYKQNVPQLLQNPKVHCHFHRNLPLETNLSHLNPIHALTQEIFTMPRKLTNKRRLLMNCA